MSAINQYSSPITGTGKVLALQTDTAVPVRLAKKLLDSETRSVFPLRKEADADDHSARSALPETDRPVADVLPLGYGAGEMPLDKESEVVDVAVSRAGIRRSDLELEITECLVVENLAVVEQILRTLTAKGACVVVDGFGTGYSSLAYLVQLSISTVKVGRAFIKQITEDVRAERIVNFIIAMARELGLGLTAEGIETEEQHRFLLENGCELGQGYGFARPQSAEAVERFLS